MRSLKMKHVTSDSSLLFVAFLNCVFIYSVFELLFGSFFSEQSLDEPTHQRYLQEDFSFIHRSDGPVVDRIWDGSGNSFQFLGHLLNSFFGNDQFLKIVSNSAQSIQIRHLLVAFLGFATCLAIRTLRHRSFQSACLLASTILISTPVFKGHSFFNPKDIPFAAGFTFIWVAILNLRDVESPVAKISNLNKFLLFFGTFLSAGTRPGSIGLIAMILIYGFISRPKFRWKIVTFTFIGLLACFVVNPRSWDNPVLWVVKHSLGSARNNYWGGVNLVYGSTISGSDLPWWYFPGLLVIQFPIILIAITVVSIIFSIRINNLKFHQTGFNHDNADTIFLICLLIFPILLSILSNSILYNNARQLLFLYPILSLLASKVINKAISTDSLRTNIAKVAIAFSLMVPTIEGTRLFPYNYVWINEIARIIGTNDAWEFDYWAISGREANNNIPVDKSIYNWPYDAGIIDSSTDVWISGWLDPNFPKPPLNCDLGYVTRPLYPKAIRLSFYGHCTKTSS